MARGLHLWMQALSRATARQAQAMGREEVTCSNGFHESGATQRIAGPCGRCTAIISAPNVCAYILFAGECPALLRLWALCPGSVWPFALSAGTREISAAIPPASVTFSRPDCGPKADDCRFAGRSKNHVFDVIVVRATAARRVLAALELASRVLWQLEEECRPLARLRFNPDAAAVLFHNLPRDSEPHTGPWIRVVLDTLKQSEDAFSVPRIDSDAVVLHREYPGVLLRCRRNMDLRPAART